MRWRSEIVIVQSDDYLLRCRAAIPCSEAVGWGQRPQIRDPNSNELFCLPLAGFPLHDSLIPSCTVLWLAIRHPPTTPGIFFGRSWVRSSLKGAMFVLFKEATCISEAVRSNSAQIIAQEEGLSNNLKLLPRSRIRSWSACGACLLSCCVDMDQRHWEHPTCPAEQGLWTTLHYRNFVLLFSFLYFQGHRTVHNQTCRTEASRVGTK